MTTEDQMSEVESRLEEALLFKKVLSMDLLTENDGPLAAAVELRIKNLIREELQIIMGMKKKEDTLEAEEVNALKQIAQRLITKSSNTETPVESKVNTLEAPTVTPESALSGQEIELTLPNGMKVKTQSRNQILPADYKKPTLQDIADQAANQAQFQALNFTPKTGILGLAVSVANQGMIPSNHINDEEEQQGNT